MPRCYSHYSVVEGIIVTRHISNNQITESKTLLKGSYSTAEIDTGYKWIDGKSIYKKTINFGSMPAANSNKSVNHGVALDSIVSFDGMITNTAGTNRQPIPLATGAIFVWTDISNTQITINTNGDRSAYNAFVTLFYTKS